MAEAAAEETNNSSLSVVDEPGVEVVSGEKEEAIRRVTRVRELREEHQQLFMSYAEEMYYINKNSLFHFVENPETGKKYTNFKEFIEAETEYKVRRARYMIAIWEWYVEEHDRSFLEEVQQHGWTKLSKLVGKMTPEDYEQDWKDKLSDLSVRDLEKLLEEDKSPKEKGQIEKEPTPEGMRTDPTNRVTFQLFDEQESNLNLAMKQAKSMTGSDSKGVNLEAICLEFLSTHHSSNERVKPIHAMMESLEKNLDGTIVFFKDGKVRYGQQYIEENDTPEEVEEDVEEI